MYSFCYNILTAISSFIRFILNVMWHYHYYCDKEVKEKNPDLYLFSKQQTFTQVVKDAWADRWGD